MTLSKLQNQLAIQEHKVGELGLELTGSLCIRFDY